MEKTFIPADIESKWYAHWEQSNYFSPTGNGTPFCIMLPPPNVTGSLHMGHGFQQTLMDALSRYHRMCGKNTLWQVGTDHAGISTQMVVERQLEAQGKKRLDFEREDFINKIWDWKQTSGSTITNQMRRIGDSVDWSKERFTMDDGLSDAVQKVFIELYEQGLIYRGKRLVNWCPKLKTAVSDLEVLSEEEQGSLWHIQYPIKDSDETLTIATTRPETMLGDTAIAINPEDPRYQHLIGQYAIIPIVNREIPVIADDYVDAEFGSGCVKITPAHDFNDYEIGKRHKLPMINILNKDATLNEQVPEAYQNLDRFIARKQLLDELESLGLLVKTEPHTLKVPRGEKSNAIIEPMLTEQWYVKMESLAQPAIDVVRKGEIKFVPEMWTKTYYQWLENIEDWCISRQLWWGHRIPAWYDTDGNIYVGYSEKDVRFKHQLDDSVVLQQDQDVLDTWFSSALWPFSTLGWPEQTSDLDTFYPSSVLVTGFDIIFFWVARMIMMGLKFVGKVPFKEVYITGLIRDHEGKKMSKSKGNVLDPLDIIDGISLEELLEKRTKNLMLGSAKQSIIKNTKKEFADGIQAYGTDPLRFTYCALATPGRNIRFDMNRVEGYRNFCNKLWNASRYVFQNTNNSDDLGDGPLQYSEVDRWIVSRLQHTISKIHQYFASYRFDLLANAIYEFVWHEYCDWYLELSKPVLYDSQSLPAMKRGTQRTLILVLEQILRLAHPVMPFITEEIWQKASKLCGKTEDSIMIAPYPMVKEEQINTDVEAEIEWLKQVIQKIRTIRSEMNVPPSLPIKVLLQNGSELAANWSDKYQHLLKNLAKVESIEWLKAGATPPTSATALVDTLEIHIPLAGIIDVNAEVARLTKEIEKLNKEKLRSEAKLSNEKFVAKAPPEVITKEQERLSSAEKSMELLSEKLNQLQTLA